MKRTIYIIALLISLALVQAQLNGSQSYTLDEVSQHDQDADCWVVVFDNVYDLTGYIDEHPGGDVFNCGEDNTAIYQSEHGTSTALINDLLLGPVGDDQDNSTDGDGNQTNETVYGTIDIMKHLCPVEIQDQDDLDALGDFLDKETTCPTIVLPDDEHAQDTINAGEYEFEIIVEGDMGDRKNLSDAQFVQQQACESQAGVDLDGDGNISETTCYDTSFYRFNNISMGRVGIIEAVFPQDARYGDVVFTPSEFDNNTDAQSLVTEGNSVIELNTTDDEDRRIMLHLYNFRNEEDDGNVTPPGNQTNQTPTNDTTGVDLYVKEWYPKGPDFVFVCNATGFTPTRYHWFYGDGEKLVFIENEDTYHVYDAIGNYSVLCVAANDFNVQTTSIDVNVTTLDRPTNQTPNDTGQIDDLRGEVMVMKHLCDESIQSEQDFIDVEEEANSSIEALARTVAACPTITDIGDSPSGGAVSGGQHDFNFQVMDKDNDTFGTDDAEFVNRRLCETDIDVDVDEDGSIQNTTCLDTSHYRYWNVTVGNVTVTESVSPGGSRFGTVRFTPAQLDGNNDQDTLQSYGNGSIKLDTSRDQNGLVMLHVYNFMNVNQSNGGGTPGNGTGGNQTPGNGTGGGGNQTANNPLNCEAIAEKLYGLGIQNGDVCDVIVVRQAPQIMGHDGMNLNKFTLMNSVLEFTPVPSRLNDTVYVMGDFSLLETELNPVIGVLVGNNWTVTGIHNHMILETPKTTFLHWETRGSLDEVIKEAKEAFAKTSIHEGITINDTDGDDEANESVDDGEEFTYRVTIQNLMTGQPLSPFAAATHESGLKIFEQGLQASQEIEAVAEDGNNTPLLQQFAASALVTDYHGVATPLRGTDFNGSEASFELVAEEGDLLSLASMLGCTNDGFTGLAGVAMPESGQMSYDLYAYDAGSENNTELSEDIPDGCNVLGPVALPDDGNNEGSVDTQDAIASHPGLDLTGDLESSHEWDDPVARVTIERVGSTNDTDGADNDEDNESSEASLLDAQLSGDEEVPPVDTEATGSATASLEGDILSVSGSFSGLESDLHEVAGSSAHIHVGDPGEAGSVVFPLEVDQGDDNRSGTFSLNAALTEPQKEELLSGSYYINVHSEDYPQGEIRGQLTSS